MKKSISLSFILIAFTAGYFALFSVVGNLRSLFSFAGLMPFIRTLTSLVLALIPIALVFLMHLNTQENMKNSAKKQAHMICIAGGLAAFLQLIMTGTELIRSNATLHIDVFALQFGWLPSVFTSFLYIMVFFDAAMRISDNNKAFWLKKLTYTLVVLFIIFNVIQTILVFVINGVAPRTLLDSIYMLGLCMMPMVFVDRSKVKNLSSGSIVVVLIIMLAVVVSITGGRVNGSTEKEPWEELGVSEREYMEIYSYIRDRS